MAAALFSIISLLFSIVFIIIMGIKLLKKGNTYIG
jgi:hypothetical protein